MADIFLTSGAAPAVGFLALAAPALACPALLLYHSAASELIAAFLVGASAGAEINVYVYIIPRYFGVRHFGLLFGVIDAIITAGLGVGPFTAGYLFDRFGNYTNVPSAVRTTIPGQCCFAWHPGNQSSGRQTYRSKLVTCLTLPRTLEASAIPYCVSLTAQGTPCQPYRAREAASSSSREGSCSIVCTRAEHIMIRSD